MQIKYPRSPLRYPGGKSRVVEAICSLIPESTTKLCSPFLGGGSVELACSTRMAVHGSDIFAPLMTFWKACLSNREELCSRVKKYHPLSRSKFYDLQKGYREITNEVERAAVFFVLNRASFSGTTLSGGMSLGHPRFTATSIERLSTFQMSNFSVECADFTDVIPKANDAFLYVDPPYLNGQRLYGVNGDLHTKFDHKRLFKLLHQRDKWILSYNDCEEIRELYKNYPILLLKWAYENEILVLSNDLR